jgi:hypothetical protein
MSALCEAVVFLLLALPAIGHSQAFEVISIKPACSGDPRNMRMRVLPNGDLNASAMRLSRVTPLSRATECQAAGFSDGLLGGRAHVVS